ncbi:hypothetical protein C8T65DRAFT_743778 [Cerioporus squamosus]|nr:hypothetical protein C8T65DRAFT_743778 [Cerioporus squamosus]
MDEDADDYNDEASSAMYAETFDSWINPDYIEPEDHAAAEPQAGSVSLSQPEAFALTGVIDDALQTIQSIVAQSNASYYDNARHVTPPSTRARLSPARSPPTRSPFAPPVSPPQEGPPVVEHDYSSPHVFPPVPTSQTSEPALPGCRFGFPNLTERSKRGSKRGHGAEIGPRSGGRTPKRPRLARSSQPESGESPLGPVASSPSSSGLATSPRTSVSDRENARKSPARSPLRIWGVAPSVPATSAPRAAEDRASLAAGTNTPPAPAPTTTDRPPLAARTNSPPSSTPASVPVPTSVRTYLELAGYPEHARDLPGEFYDDIRRVGAELAPRGLSAATWPAAPPSPSRQKNKGKGKAAVTVQVKNAKKPQKRQRKQAVAKYFCPFYTPPIPPIPGYPHQNLFAVPSPNVPGAAPAPPPHLVSCTRTEPYGRQADALRHVRWMHIKPRTFCILDGAPASALPFNRSDAIKRHLKESDVCMPKGGFDLLVHDLAARLGLRIDDADAPDPKARQVAKRNRGKCEAMVARQWTRIVMPCYQEPAVRATIGVYLRWSRKSLARLEDEMRAQALVVERCACEGCREPRQAWAEEWAKGRVDVPVWYGEWAAGEDLALGGDGVRRRQKKQGEDVDTNEDEEDEEEHEREHKEEHEHEEEEEDGEEERAAPTRTPRRVYPKEASETTTGSLRSQRRASMRRRRTPRLPPRLSPPQSQGRKLPSRRATPCKKAYQRTPLHSPGPRPLSCCSAYAPGAAGVFTANTGQRAIDLTTERVS